MKKLAIFDLDGTLFNTNDVNYFAYSDALKEQGYELNYDYYCKYCNGRHYRIFLPEIIDKPNVIEIVHNRKKELYSEYLGKAIINTHLFNIINNLKKDYHIALVTTASKKNTYDILEYFDKLNLFDYIITHEDVEKVKPNPEGFLKAMNHFGTNKEDTIIFEDSKVGIQAARQTGASVFVIDKF